MERNWPEVEEDLGLGLPADYKRLAEAYGPGWFSTLEFFDMREAFHGSSLSTSIKQLIGSVFHEHVMKVLKPEVAQALAPESSRFFPEEGGLLLFGFLGEDRRRPLCWLTKGNPDSWDVVYVDATPISHFSPAQFIRFEHTNATTFIHQYLSGEVAASHPDATIPEPGVVAFTPSKQPPEYVPSGGRTPDYDALIIQTGTDLDEIMREIRDRPRDLRFRL